MNIWPFGKKVELERRSPERRRFDKMKRETLESYASLDPTNPEHATTIRRCRAELERAAKSLNIDLSEIELPDDDKKILPHPG